MGRGRRIQITRSSQPDPGRRLSALRPQPGPREGGDQVRPGDDADDPALFKDRHRINVTIGHHRQEHPDRSRRYRPRSGDAHDVLGTDRLRVIPVDQAPKRREIATVEPKRGLARAVDQMHLENYAKVTPPKRSRRTPTAGPR